MLSAASTWGAESVFFDICRRKAKDVEKIESFNEWTRVHVRPLLPHGALRCIHGHICETSVSPDYVATIDYPLGHLEEIRDASGRIDTPLDRLWFTRQTPIFFDVNDSSDYAPTSWLLSFRKHGLRNAAVHGILEPTQDAATYFSFHQLPILDEPVLTRIFEMVIPLMHETFIQATQPHRKSVARPVAIHKTLAMRDMSSALAPRKNNGEIASPPHLFGRPRLADFLRTPGRSNHA